LILLFSPCVLPNESFVVGELWQLVLTWGKFMFNYSSMWFGFKWRWRRLGGSGGGDGGGGGSLSISTYFTTYT